MRIKEKVVFEIDGSKMCVTEGAAEYVGFRL